MKTIYVESIKEDRTFLRNLALGVIVCLFFLTLPSLCGAHSQDGHDHHDHSHGEPASFKYSRQANEDILKNEAAGAAASHGHTHGAGGCNHAHGGDALHHHHHDHEHDGQPKTKKALLELGNTFVFIFNVTIVMFY